MRVNDCFKKRLLRKDKPDMLKLKKALEMAEAKRERALELFDNSFFEESIVASYTGMFQASRALLFKDGIIERSHACVIAYLREKYVKNLGHDRVGWLDTYRLERHESFYGLESSRFNKMEAKDALDKSEKFLQSIKAIIGKK
jgi:uncharacterized protein (UPF0332 family)